WRGERKADARAQRAAVAAELRHDTPLSRSDRVGAGEHQPDQNEPDHSPQDQGAVGQAGQAAAAITAEPCPAPTEQLLERGAVRPAEARAPGATRRLTPRPAAMVALIGRGRIDATLAAARPPWPLGVGEQAADAAAPPGNDRHRCRI